MRFIEILCGALRELERRPLLFLPKFISVTIYAILYILLFQKLKELLATGRNPEQILLYIGALLLFMPFWIIIDSMYPSLVKQSREKKELDFFSALKNSLKKFLKIFSFILIFFFASAILFLPFFFLIAYALAFKKFLLLLIGIGGGLLIALILAILTYFIPTTILLEEIGFISAFAKGFSLAKKNLPLVSYLSIFSFLVLLLGFAFEGAFETIGIIGFFFGRYLGGALTVYLYILNPSAYLSLRRKLPPQH